jgi:hypothetical protein
MPSMGSVGDAYDNTMAESFFASLQRELLGLIARVRTRPRCERKKNGTPPATLSRRIESPDGVGDLGVQS